MHAEVLDWVTAHATDEPVSVLDIGGRDVNGTVRAAFPGADPYLVLDLRSGENVDVVANAATWAPDREFDVVVCTEVFEHTPDWAAICATAFKALRVGGRFVVTCAGPGRGPHSGISAFGGPTSEEWYANVGPDELGRVLAACGFRDVTVQTAREVDVRAVAWR
jgi:SAM-dependent methyltransferase